MVKLDLRLMGFIKVFEDLTKAGVKDCFFDRNDILVFVVKQGEIGKAIGKKGVNVKNLSNKLKKRVKIIEFNSDVCRFIKNCLMPLKIDVLKEDNKVVIKCSSRQDKGIVLGRDRNNLNALKELVGKFFNVEILVE